MNPKKAFSCAGPSAALLGVVLLANPVFLLAQNSPGFHVGVMGGAGISNDNGRTDWVDNYQVSGFLGYNASGPFGGRLEIGYSPSDSVAAGPRAADATRRVTYGFGDVIIAIREGAVRPYGLFGIGILDVRADATGHDPFGQIPPYPIHDAQTVFGFNIGGGISVPLGSKWSAFAEAKYIHGSTNLHDPLSEDGLGLFFLVAGISF